MKKLFFLMAAAAALFTSCSKDDTIGGLSRGKVTFEVSAPELATRYGEGTTATTLQYAVYDMVENTTEGKLVDTGSATLNNKAANVAIDLVEGRKYSVIFWADAGADSPYTFTPAAKTVSYKNTSDLQANQESYDAFFAYVPKEQVKVGETVTVELKRPFAQLRIETSDKERAAHLGVNVEKTGITVNAYTSFNLETGVVDGKQELTFAPTTAASATTTVDGTQYDLISMNYLLVNNKEAVDVTLNFTDKISDTQEETYVRKYNAINIQRNYRTLVRGTILTDPTNFDVTVKEGFDGDYTADGNNSAAQVVSTVQELQNALDNALDGTTIYIAADIEGDVVATQKEGVKITIEGQNKSYKGMITVDGGSSTPTTAGLTIKNLSFDAESINSDACINLGKKGDNSTRYTCNVTVEGCTFDVPGAVGIKSYTGGDKNLIIKNCTATSNAHSLVQAKGIDPILVEGCEVYSKNGLNFNNSLNVTVDNCTVDVKGYAVRFGDDICGNGTIKNSSLKSANDDGDAVIVLRGNANDSSILNITNTKITGDPAITNSTTNAIVIIDGVPTVNSAAGLAAVVEKGYTNINLADGEYDVYGCGGKTLTLNGSENAVLKLNNEGEDGCDYAFGGNGTGVGNITFNGLTINTEANTGNYKGFAYMKGTFNNCKFVGSYSLNNANDFVFNSCTFNFNGYLWTWGANSVKFDSCTFNGDSRAILAHGSASTVITINNCNFAATEEGKTAAGDWTACVEIDPASTNVYTINFTGTNNKTEKYNGWTRIKDSSTGHTITGVE